MLILTTKKEAPVDARWGAHWVQAGATLQYDTQTDSIIKAVRKQHKVQSSLSQKLKK